MIRLDKDGDLWIATLARADKANSLTSDMLGAGLSQYMDFVNELLKYMGVLGLTGPWL